MFSLSLLRFKRFTFIVCWSLDPGFSPLSYYVEYKDGWWGRLYGVVWLVRVGWWLCTCGGGGGTAPSSACPQTGNVSDWEGRDGWLAEIPSVLLP